MIVRLDFGGGVRRARTIRIDRSQRDGVHLLAELSPQLPFRENSADEIFLDRSLAHAENFVGIMEELWRISRPNALIHLRLPHASSPWAVSRDPRHPQPYTLETFNYFDPRYQNPACASPATFRVEHARLYLAGPRRNAGGLARARSVFAHLVESVANRNRGMQYRWERWFAPLVGGFEELSVVLRAVKERADG